MVKMVESIGIDDIEGPAWKSVFPFQRQTILHGSVNQNTDSSMNQNTDSSVNQNTDRNRNTDRTEKYKPNRNTETKIHQLQ